jgi:hypothetical protein
MAHGEVSVAPESALQDGRLIVRVAILNRDKTEVPFNLESVQLSTANGKAVPILSVDQLTREVVKAVIADHRSAIRSTDHQQNNYAMNDNAAIRDSSGSIVSGNYGGTAVGANSYENMAEIKSLPEPVIAEINAQVVGLKAGLLQSKNVAPGQVVAGQIVTDKLRLGRKDPRVLKMTVIFNQEQHEFLLDVPAEKK